MSRLTPVRWRVAKKAWRESFRNRAQAESFRSELLAAARKGEAFDIATGRPVSMLRIDTDMTWYHFACSYVDMKWKSAAATYRRGIAEAMTTATCALFATVRGKPDDKTIRSALFRWAFNTPRRNDSSRPEEVSDVLRWVERNTRPVSALASATVLRGVLDAFATKLDNRPSAATVVNRKRAVLSNALEYAVELGLLPSNPVGSIKWKAPRTSHVVDRRSVVNPVQARTLLKAVQGRLFKTLSRII
jgi:hypothetical protein